MEVLYHIGPYSMGIFPYIGLTCGPNIYGSYLQFRFLKWALKKTVVTPGARWDGKPGRLAGSACLAGCWGPEVGTS